MTEIYLHFLFAHYGLYGNAPVVVVCLKLGVALFLRCTFFVCMLHSLAHDLPSGLTWSTSTATVSLMRMNLTYFTDKHAVKALRNIN